jgi:serine/threonine protein kinase
LGTPTKENITNMNPKGKVRLKIPNIPKKNWKLIFKDKIDNDEFIDLVDKLIQYEPNKRLTPYQALLHPFFNELKLSKTKLPNSKNLPTHLFEFKKCEIEYDKESISKLISQIEK